MNYFETEKDQELIKYVYDNLTLNIIPKGHDEFEKMISGIPYNPWTEELISQREEAHQSSREYSAITYRGKTRQEYYKARIDHLKTFIGEIKGDLCIEAPFTVDYGCNVSIGSNFYANFNLTILDSSIVTIGDDVEFGPNVVLCCATHPLSPTERFGPNGEWAKKIVIGNKVWLGANVTVLPGVTIGDGVVVGANAVVTKDIPPYSLAVGAPARVVKEIEH